MKINTGRGTIPLITLIGIWSISALTSLPGLAVSPILGQLSTTFPDASELDIQMLSSLPSLLIIPFILLAGKLAEKRDFVRLLRAGLWMFAASGVLYLFSTKMWQLIAVSALLGIGAGLIIPLSTGLISRYFTGTYRVKQFGYSSAITNVTLVVATAVTGYLAEVNWHLPFLVYLLPLVAIILTIHLKDENMGGEAQVTSSDKSPADTSSSVETAAPAIPGKYGIHVRHLLQLMLFYGLTTYIVLIVTFNLPFLMEAHHFSSGNSGMMISLFFLAIMAPGFFLGHVVKYLKEKTKFYSLLCIALGLSAIPLYMNSAVDSSLISTAFSSCEEVITLSFVIFCTAFGTNRPAAAATIPRTSTLPMIFFFIQLLLSRFPLLYCIISFSSTGIFLFPNLKKDAML